MCVQPPQVCNDGDDGDGLDAGPNNLWIPFQALSFPCPEETGLFRWRNGSSHWPNEMGRVNENLWRLTISLPHLGLTNLFAKKKSSQPPETLVSMMACNGLIYIQYLGPFHQMQGTTGAKST